MMNEVRNSVRDILLDATFDDEQEKIKIYLHGVDIDGIPGRAKFYKIRDKENNMKPVEYAFIFTAKVLRDTDVHSDYFINVNDVLDKFEKIMNYKFVGDSLYDDEMFVSLKKYEEQQKLYTYMCHVKKKELEECYVCSDPTYGHKTTCGHYICPYCYYKSLKPCDYSTLETDEQIIRDCGEIKAIFVCGICRKTISGCDVHRSY